MPDLYNVLGLKRGASDDEIRRAYRKLAKELHPDRNPGDKQAEDRFKEVSKAYDILGDKDKRQAYDRGEIDEEGRERFQQGFGGFGGFGQGGGGRGFGDGFAQGFGGSRRGFRYQTRSGPGGPTDFGGFEDILSSVFGGGRGGFGFESAAAGGGDTRYEISLDFLDAARGGKQRLTLADGSTLDVNIPPGIEDGQTLRLKGQGAGGGDTLLTVKVRPHPRFERKGRDIHVDVEVPLATAVTGGKVQVPTIDGDVALSVPAGTSSGRSLRLKGRGIKHPRTGERGDQYARVLITLPTAAEDTAALKHWARGKVTE
ncbi:MAG: DnaJ C-terminal domain-containing protein [Alphaproteobacteria bacterium]